MANDYYEEQFSGQSFGLAKVEALQASLQRVQGGFAKLPREVELKTDSTTSAVATGGPQNYTVRLPYAPSGYVDQMRIGVRFPVANVPNPNLAVVGENGNSLGFKPIRQIDGTPLSAGHIGTLSEGLLQYSVDADAVLGDGQPNADLRSGYWTLMAGARGAEGRPGPPQGTFSVNAMKELVFSPDDGGATTNLGAIAPLFQGAYSSSTTYSFLDLVRDGAYLYLHVGIADTTGTATSDGTVWQRYSDLPVDGGMLVEFRTATSQADPGNGRMRFNNATPANVTSIYLDDQDVSGNVLSAWVDTWDDYGSDPSGQLVIRGTGGNTEALVFNLTAVAALSGYRRLSVSHVAGSSLPGNGDVVSIVPLLRGATGADGAHAPGGGLTGPADAKSSNYTVTADDAGKTIEVNASGGARTVNLPNLGSDDDGFTLTVIKTDSSTNAVTIDGNGSDTINGAATFVIKSRWESMILKWTGSVWIGIGGVSPAFLRDFFGGASSRSWTAAGSYNYQWEWETSRCLAIIIGAQGGPGGGGGGGGGSATNSGSAGQTGTPGTAGTVGDDTTVTVNGVTHTADGGAGGPGGVGGQGGYGGAAGRSGFGFTDDRDYGDGLGGDGGAPGSSSRGNLNGGRGQSGGRGSLGQQRFVEISGLSKGDAFVINVGNGGRPGTGGAGRGGSVYGIGGNGQNGNGNGAVGRVILIPLF